MITRQRRAHRPDSTIYRQIRRRKIAGNILLEATGSRHSTGHGKAHRNVLQLARRSLRFLLKFLKFLPGRG